MMASRVFHRFFCNPTNESATSEVDLTFAPHLAAISQSEYQILNFTRI